MIPNWNFYAPQLRATLTEAEYYNIMEQAVAPCPEITMTIKGQKVRALLDMGSQVTLMNESYFVKKFNNYFRPWTKTI